MDFRSYKLTSTNHLDDLVAELKLTGAHLKIIDILKIAQIHVEVIHPHLAFLGRLLGLQCVEVLYLLDAYVDTFLQNVNFVPESYDLLRVLAFACPPLFGHASDRLLLLSQLAFQFGVLLYVVLYDANQLIVEHEVIL